MPPRPSTTPAHPSVFFGFHDGHHIMPTEAANEVVLRSVCRAFGAPPPVEGETLTIATLADEREVARVLSTDSRAVRVSSVVVDDPWDLQTVAIIGGALARALPALKTVVVVNRTPYASDNGVTPLAVAQYLYPSAHALAHVRVFVNERHADVWPRTAARDFLEIDALCVRALRAEETRVLRLLRTPT